MVTLVLEWHASSIKQEMLLGDVTADIKSQLHQQQF